MTDLTTYTPNIVITETAHSGLSFDRLQVMAEKTVSKSSARVYKHTWGAWRSMIH